MSIAQTKRRQRGVSVWTVSGSVLIAAGVAGIGVALINSRGSTASVTPVATKSGAATPGAAVVKPAAPSTAPTPSVAPTLAAKPAAPGSGPHANWHATWQSVTPAAPMVVTSTRFGACKWVDSPDPTFEGECQAGYAPTSMSLADITRSYEEAVAQFQNTPNPISAADATRSREYIGRIKPGNYRVVMMFDGSECSLSKMIIDGDSLLRIVHCGYRQQVSLLNRGR